MTPLAFSLKHPTKGYLNNNLLLPKTLVNARSIRQQLSFIVGVEDTIDPTTNEIVGQKSRMLEAWDETEHHLIVPREFVPSSSRSKLPFTIELDLPPFERVSLAHHIKFRNDRQKQAFAAMGEHLHTGGTLNLSCGRGKTVLALRLAAEKQQPTIIIVNTSALLEQWIDEIQTHLGGATFGVVQGDRADWQGKPIVVAMIHTLANRREQWPLDFHKRFGLVVFDECHHVSAPTFVRAADLFFGQRLALTATATRTDGLEAIYQYHLGPVIYSNLTQDLIPSTRFTVLDYVVPQEEKALMTDSSGQVNMSLARSFVGQLKWRNELIMRDCKADLDSGRQLLVLSHSLYHLDLLQEMLEKAGLRPGLITGETPQAARLSTLRMKNPVLGTFQLAREGLNKPELDTLYITTPFGNSNDMQQSWGRIQREHAGKLAPLVRVYEDVPISCAVRACRNLRRFLRALDYPYSRKKVQVST